MLGEERFDFENASACPILEPGFAQVILDLVKAAFTHDLNIGRDGGRRHGPNGSFEGVVSPTKAATPGLQTPVEFRVEPGALSVLVPTPESG